MIAQMRPSTAKNLANVAEVAEMLMDGSLMSRREKRVEWSCGLPEDLTRVSTGVRELRRINCEAFSMEYGMINSKN